MLVGQLLRDLDTKALWKLLRICLSNMSFIYPTLLATKNCISYTEQEFGDQHHKNNNSNAFRHALWNYLILDYSIQYLNSEKRSLLWAKKITDLHEELFKNSPLEKAMDDHNNAAGRVFYLANRSCSKKENMKSLKYLADSSIAVQNISEIKAQSQEQLVHLNE